jgi:hypothetical protein
MRWLISSRLSVFAGGGSKGIPVPSSTGIIPISSLSTNPFSRKRGTALRRRTARCFCQAPHEDPLQFPPAGRQQSLHPDIRPLAASSKKPRSVFRVSTLSLLPPCAPTFCAPSPACRTSRTSRRNQSPDPLQSSPLRRSAPQYNISVQAHGHALANFSHLPTSHSPTEALCPALYLTTDIGQRRC